MEKPSKTLEKLRFFQYFQKIADTMGKLPQRASAEALGLPWGGLGDALGGPSVGTALEDPPGRPNMASGTWALRSGLTQFSFRCMYVLGGVCLQNEVKSVRGKFRTRLPPAKI